MKLDLKNRIADIDHRFYLHNAKVKEGEKALEDGTNVSGGGYYCFGYEDNFQRIKVQIDKEIKNFRHAVNKAKGLNSRTSKQLAPRRTLKGK